MLVRFHPFISQFRYNSLQELADLLRVLSATFEIILDLGFRTACSGGQRNFSAIRRGLSPELDHVPRG